MKNILLILSIICTLNSFSQEEKNSKNPESDYMIYYKDGSSEKISDVDPKKLIETVSKIISCNDSEGKCSYKNKAVDRMVVKAGYKGNKGNKRFEPINHIFTPLNFSKVFVKPIKGADLNGLPKLIYQGKNYDYYEGTILAAGDFKDYAILTKPKEREVVAIISARYSVDGKVFNYKYLLNNSTKMFVNPEPIEKSINQKDYKNDNFNPYLLMDNAGELIEGKIHNLN